MISVLLITGAALCYIVLAAMTAAILDRIGIDPAVTLVSAIFWPISAVIACIVLAIFLAFKGTNKAIEFCMGLWESYRA